ncbi:MAG: oligopeptide:H+ symporter [Pirellulales bacterium]|nr:oligopeptide:H+ symporter [Pirellulales bacterium]
MASILSRAGGYFRSHPIGFWFIFWGELAERCSYYGMRAILALYMTEKLGFSETSASRVMAYFIAACYFLPLVGGWVADNVLGKYWTIVGFSAPYILGHVILGVETTTYLYIALALLAMGSGVIKPNISTLMGMTYDQERPGQEQMRSDAFAMFYGAVNIGAALSSMAMPVIRNRYDYATAFLFPAGLMVLAFGFFAAGKRFYAREEIVHRASTPEERAAKFELLMRLGAIFATVTFFWCIFDQSPSTWTFFAKSHLDLNLFGYQLAPDQLQSLNPLFIVTLLPLVTIGWRVLAMLGLPLRPTSKMLVGFVLTGVCMAIMSAAGFLAGDGRVSVLWEVVAYLLITVAEICISVVGLELSFAAAPKSMKSFVSACWLLPIFIGNMLNAQVVELYEAYDPGAYFGLMALMMIPVTIAFIFAARAFNRHEPPREITGEPAPEDEAARAF